MKYIVSYNSNPQIIENVYEPDSYKIIAGRYVVISYDEEIEFMEVQEFAYPKCYGLCQSKILEQTGVSEVRRITGLNLYGGGVNIGLIDDWVDIEAPVLKNADGSSKVAYYYDQKTGVEYGKEEIEKIVLRNSRQYADYTTDVENTGFSHGTMMASIMCGEPDQANGEFSGIVPSATLLVAAVKMADKSEYEHYNISQGAKAYSEVDIIEAVEKIVNASSGKPLVLVLPFETNFGSHSGSGALEDYLSYLNEQLHIVVVTPAGNMAVSKAHCEGNIYNSLQENDIKDLSFVVKESGTDSFITLVMSQGAKPILTIESPTGERKQVSVKGDDIKFLYEQSQIQIKTEVYDLRSELCMVYIRCNNLSEGIWKMYLQTGNVGWKVHYSAYFPVTDFQKGEVEFLSPTAENTITSPGDARLTCTVGAYDAENGKIYPPSGRGEVNGKPELCAPGVNISGYDTESGRIKGFSGTSVSAAVTAATAAIILQWAVVYNNKKYMTGTALKLLLIAGSDSLSNNNPEAEWGFGKLNILGSFEAIRS